MKRIAAFCIPAHGHTNPMLPVVAELVRRGNEVRFYSFEEFREKIEKTGAAFVSCDAFLPALSTREEERLKKVSSTEMTIQDIRITLAMDDFLRAEFERFRPDVVFTDSVCFWGKLNAWKYEVPMVVSTSTFAFNQMSSQYMKNSPAEVAGLILGLPRVQRALNSLKPYGYKIKGLFSLIQTDNDTDSLVYTSRRFQPYAESFSAHTLFAGPSLFSDAVPVKDAARPLVYISMGTVINDRPDFYHKCIEALKDLPVEVVISCGKSVALESFDPLPENVRVYPSVDQLDVLSRSSVFLTHCGMNSVSESLYMAAPMLLYPQTNEQAAVARRVAEIGAGRLLRDDSAEGIRKAVLELLGTPDYAEAAQACSADFRSCPGTAGAADFIESAPHSSDGVDVIKELGRASARCELLYSVLTVLVAVLLFRFLSKRFLWLYIIAAVLLGFPIKKAMQNAAYRRLIRKLQTGGRHAAPEDDAE